MHQIDERLLETYLARHVDGFTTLDSMTRFNAGQSNPTYAVTSGSRQFVLRAQPVGHLLPSAHAVDREFTVMSALADHDVPVPVMRHLAPASAPLGVMFVVMDHVAGDIHWDPALPNHTQSQRKALYAEMNMTLARLHTIDPATAGLDGFGKPGDYFARQLNRWSRQYAAAQAPDSPDISQLLDWLARNLPADDGQVAIVHGDYRIDNMIFGPDQTLRAVLDWELSTLGHPFADLGYQCMMWRMPNSGAFKGLDGLDRVALGLPSDEDYVGDYCARRDIALPHNWTFYVAFASFRLLAILQGVLKRGLDGTAANPMPMQDMKDAIGFLAQDARDLIADKA